MLLIIKPMTLGGLIELMLKIWLGKILDALEEKENIAWKLSPNNLEAPSLDV